jgi:hypothetical protein
MKKMILSAIVALFVTGTTLYAKDADCCAKKKSTCCAKQSDCCK